MNPGDIYKVTEQHRRADQRCDSVTHIRPQSTVLLAPTANEYMNTDSNRNNKAVSAVARSKSAQNQNYQPSKEVISTRRNSRKAAERSPGSSPKKQQLAAQNSAKKTAQSRYVNVLNQKRHAPSKSTASEKEQFKTNSMASEINYRVSNFNTLKNSPEKQQTEIQSFGSPVIELKP